MRGVPVIILSTRGRHSGAIRKLPLMRVTDGERYAVIASLGGAPKHPVWYLNLQADPVVALQDKAVKRRYLAHTAVGEEREEWWRRAVAVWPDYARYQTKTDREIPVVILEPLPDQD
jgi:deazaflavin-dependent oxidoreductase (nitroreductase family)